MQIVILLFQCKDQKGIVAKVTDFIFKHNGNIITADQHSTNPTGGHFFMRLEFCVDKNLSFLKKDFAQVAKKFKAQWEMRLKNEILRMGIMVSKPDHCLVDLLYLYGSKELKVKIPFVISNCESHRQLVRQCGIPFYFISAGKRDRKESQVLSIAKDSDFLVLARYMLKLSPRFLKNYGRDIINIHHGFLPSFKGANPYRQAYEKGVKVIGATAHFVNDELDAGPIISQAVEAVTHRDDVASLKSKGKHLEKRALSDAVSKYLDYRIIRYQNKTIVF